THPMKRARRAVWDWPCRCARERGERLAAESIDEIFMEPDAVGVGRGAGGPVGEPAVDAVERLQHAAARRLADNRAEIAGVQPALARDGALLVGRDPLDLPRREKNVWKRDRRAAEH